MITGCFWILLIIIAYAYLGYAIILLLLTLTKRIFTPPTINNYEFDFPEVSLLIAAFNEKEVVPAKMQNSAKLNYPVDKLSIIWVTDGSDDGTPERLNEYPNVRVLHEAERKGKTAALNRAMEYIKTPFVVFCDANTLLDEDAIIHLIKPFSDEHIGCVAGEKRIAKSKSDIATGAGEGAYWQYESWIKKLESDYHSALSAAGELYAIRTSLFDTAEPDSIIDDFVISLNIAQKGYQIKYEPRAFALESPSASIGDELKRKIRIASGGFQTLFRYPAILNFFKYGFLSFEYLSHKVIRWLLVPPAIPLLFIFNLLVCYHQNWQNPFYLTFLIAQLFFYFLAILGAFFAKNATKMKFLFLPYYLIVMNYAQIAGLIRYLRRKHSVVWEKAKRA